MKRSREQITRAMRVVILAILLISLAAADAAPPEIVIDFPGAGENLSAEFLYDGFSVSPSGEIVTNSSVLVVVRA